MMPTRRAALAAFLTAPALGLVASDVARAQPPRGLELTPACADHDAATVAEEEGPFYKPKAPLRHDLAGDALGGEKITSAGYGLDPKCRPIPGAVVQVWHANQNGEYDNAGFKLRGYQLTDLHGRWWFATIVPGLYPGRTRHYHLKVQGPSRPLLTTQLYFPKEPRNSEDQLFDQRLLLRLTEASDGKIGWFDFVL